MAKRNEGSADNWLIAGSLFIALLLNMVTFSQYDFAHWRPDFLSVMILYWSVHRPNKFGMLAAFLLGIVMDVHSGVLLGQYATAYVLLCFIGVLVHRRLMWFSLWPQAAQILPIFLFVQCAVAAVRLMIGGAMPPLSIFISPLLQALVWPIVSVFIGRVEGVLSDRQSKLTL